ncbi:MAG: M20/M25/M40 family metallo-hydrolase [Clostridia bacterium]|nr:M20/M25/M40 family metallo-hydrolase [Clostridia bacterium]
MSIEKLLKEIETKEQEYINFLIDVCNIESPTDYKKGVDAVGKYFIDKAKEKGWDVEVFSQPISGDAICITMNANAKAKPVCISGHLDTVHPVGLFPKNPTVIKEDKIYGPGVADCKGGCVAGFMAMDALEKIGFTDRPIKLILQSDEENGSRFSNKETVRFMAEKAKDCIAFLNGEPYNDGEITIERKGIKKYAFEVTGKAVHSSICFTGASAITEASYKVIELEKFKDEDGITCNCGIISGGTAENTVPEKCTITADFRYKTVEQGKFIDDFVQRLAKKSNINGTVTTPVLKSWRYPMEKTQKNQELVQKINKIYKQAGMIELTPKLGLGGADSADMTVAGIPTVDCLGTEGKYIHNVNEFIYKKSLVQSAKRLAVVVYSID